jgi:CRP-like cAMP-binding protein
MALDDDIRILSDVGLFEGFTQEQLRLLAFGAETTLLGADRKLYREDDEADSAYVVVAGRIVLYREGDGERERLVIGHVGPGAIMGELALIADTKRLTSASAEVDSEVLRLNRRMFRRILEEYPELAVKLHHRISAELQEFLQKIENLAPRFAG